MAPPVDQDKLFLDTLISLADDIYQLADRIIAAAEDPAVIILARQQKRIAAHIEKTGRDYRPRLMRLKNTERIKGKLFRQEQLPNGKNS
jgi:hypothetical protein